MAALDGGVSDELELELQLSGGSEGGTELAAVGAAAEQKPGHHHK